MCIRDSEYTILEQPKEPAPVQGKPIRENPVQANPTLDVPAQEEPAQLNKEESSKEKSKKDLSITEPSNPIQSNPQPLMGQSPAGTGIDVYKRQGKLFLVAHVRQFVFELHFLIKHTAGVEEFFQRQTAFGVPLFQFFRGRVVFHDMTVDKVYTCTFQPCFGFFAGAA